MRDPVNPEPEELRTWAADGNALEPVMDFALMATSLGNVPLIIELANSPTCPKRRFFLECLYLFVGDGVRTEYRRWSRQQVQELLQQVDQLEAKHPSVERWLERSRELMANPQAFDYDLWCDGGHAYEDVEIA